MKQASISSAPSKAAESGGAWHGAIIARRLCDVGGNAPGLVAGEQLRRRAAPRLVLEIDVSERLPVRVAYDEAGVGVLSAVRKYGLIAKNGEDYRVTDRAVTSSPEGMTTPILYRPLHVVFPQVPLRPASVQAPSALINRSMLSASRSTAEASNRSPLNVTDIGGRRHEWEIEMRRPRAGHVDRSAVHADIAVDLRGGAVLGTQALLENAIGGVVEDDEHDGDVVVRRGPQRLAGVHGAAVADERHHWALGQCELDAERRRQAPADALRAALYRASGFVQ